MRVGIIKTSPELTQQVIDALPNDWELLGKRTGWPQLQGKVGLKLRCDCFDDVPDNTLDKDLPIYGTIFFNSLGIAVFESLAEESKQESWRDRPPLL